MEKKLYKDYENKIVSGVCAGISNYFNIDATIVRLICVIITLSSFGFGVIFYIAAILIMPDKPIE